MRDSNGREVPAEPARWLAAFEGTVTSCTTSHCVVWGQGGTASVRDLPGGVLRPYIESAEPSPVVCFVAGESGELEPGLAPPC